jgi:hypothetical protein
MFVAHCSYWDGGGFSPQWMVGNAVGGLIADRILVHTNNLTLARKLLAVPALVVVGFSS